MNITLHPRRIPEISNLPMQVEQWPYRHVLQRDFLQADFYAALCAEFERIKSAGCVEAYSRTRFCRFDNYDCYNYCIPPDVKSPLAWVWSPALRDQISDLFGVPLTQDVVASLHHHLPGSQSGWIHNDYVTYPFQNRRLPNGMNPYFLRRNQVVSDADLEMELVYRRMRSIVLIYYLNNPVWEPGDGGETGLFLSESDTEAAVLAAPHNNSLLAFEISPDSYHAFRSNLRHERNSLILWYHTHTEEKIARHGNQPPIF